MYNILVADDDKEIVESIEIYLNNEGYKVFKAYDGLEALDILMREDIHLILMDIMMPKLDGIKATIKIRQDKNIPIILVSAKGEDTDKILGLNIGADDYITKPFRIRELISRINAILRRKGKIQDNKKIIKFKNISIHTLEARVFKNDEEIILTSAEYKLLLILIQNKNVVLTRAQILEKLWDVTYDFVNDNTLSVYIKRLREKIEEDSSKPEYILTVRGVGYKWNGSDTNENTI